MRTSLTLAAIIAAPVLLITACSTGASTSPLLKGTVVDKEYEPAKTKQDCKRQGGKKKCRTITIKKACYELDIRQANGQVVEICDKAAYNALELNDRYSSAIDYSKGTHR